MDLTYGGEYERFRNEVRDFIATHRDAAPDGQGMRAEKTRAWQKMLIERGYTARTIPREYGGYGGDADILKARIIAEEFAQAQVPAGLGGQGISMLVPTLLEMGTEEQKRQFIAPTLRGETIWCQGYSEPGAGSDLASLRTRAELDGDEWVVNGQKIWTSTAQHADWIFCLVRTEPNAPKHQGISFLLFSMKTPGIEVRPLKTMTGDATFNEVFFTDVRVPKGQIVGRRGEGWLVANSILRHERSSLGDPNAMLTRLNALTELMKSETLDGRRLIDDAVYRDRLMKIQGDVMAMRLNDLRLLSAKLNNKNASLAGMIVKLKGTELRHDLESLGIDVLGEIGALYRDEHGDAPYLKDHGLYQYHYMFYLGLIIGGGTSQIQKNIISERGLGMPKEPKLNKEA
ncbi:MAG TPA: acyl-CoA dehydrogenase family protein [Pseudomonadales bacterium]|jgi:alkylation response protein AidB-like acyl-CoA dehydrogenase|nr:acyl-CoA dehydrogenase family protein [Pseudomonadales bacterium]